MIYKLLTLCCLLALSACDSKPQPSPSPADAAQGPVSVPVAAPAPQPGESSESQARARRMSGFLVESDCAQGDHGEAWRQDVAQVRAAYIEGRFADSVTAAKRAMERCDEPKLARHIIDCYNMLGQSREAEQLKRQYKRALRDKRRAAKDQDAQARPAAPTSPAP